MKEIYILYKCDSWHSSNSMEVVFIGSSVENAVGRRIGKARLTSR